MNSEINDEADWKTVSSKPKASKNKAKSKSPLNAQDFLKNIPKTDNFNVEILAKIQSLIEIQPKVLIIMRGLPGAGKSTLASQLVFNGTILSADSYFMNRNGVYTFDPFKLSDAHHSCRTRALDAMKKSVSPVIIDNTNLQVWEFKPYISMGVKYNYHIELVEPNTPWKFKPSVLSEKNQHGVNLNKIKKALTDFDSNIDLEKLVTECKNEAGANANATSLQANKPRPKPGSFISNFDEFFNKVEWVIPESDGIAGSPTNLTNKSDNKSSPLSLGNTSNEETSLLTSSPPSNERFDFDESEKSLTEIDSSKDTIRQMFPHVKEEIIVDFLLKYNNDVNIVTEILLDSVSFAEETKREEPKTREKKISVIKSLQMLCIEAMEKLEARLEEIYDTNKIDKDIEKNVKFSIDDQAEQSLKKPPDESFENSVKPSSFDPELNEEPLFNLTVNREFLTTLIRIFGNEEEEKYLEDENRVGIGINIGQQLYLNWKYSEMVRKIKESKEKVEIDKKKPDFELFEEVSFMDPVENTPVDLSDKGLNFSEISLRQIMAEEELALELQKNQASKKLGNSISEINNGTLINHHFYSSPNLSMNPTNRIPKEKHYANLVKLDILFRKYQKIVDKKAIEQVFKEKDYDIAQTMEHINDFFGLSTVKDPVNKFDFSKKEDKSKGSAPNLKSNSLNISTEIDPTPEYDPNRQEARRYVKIRQQFFDKASEAYSRGWGAVAQYYAEMGNICSQQIKESNMAASTKIFNANNQDIKNNNTLDLHGLHVDEAINALKTALNTRKNELSMPNGRKRKTYIFVITGYGHHSQNGPKLRPNIINFLNQKGIRYIEPHVGLLKVELLNKI